MTVYRRTKDIDSTQAAYIAGLIDGEGTVALSRKHARDNRQLCVSISNTERRLLEYVLEIVGAGKITAKRTTRAEHTPSFMYAIHNRQALALLDQVAPYLRTYKRHRAHLILRDYVRLTPRNGKYSEAMRQERLAFERAVQDIKPGQPGGVNCPDNTGDGPVQIFGQMAQEDRQPSIEAQKSLEALRSAVRDALERKRRLGQHAVIWRNGRVEILDWREKPG